MIQLPPSIMMQMLGVKPFGPTGVVNNNNLSSVGQGLKKIFKPQPEYPRMFSSDDGGDSPKQKRGSNSGVLPTTILTPTPDLECCLYNSAGFQSKFFMKDLPDRLFSFGGIVELIKTNFTDEQVQGQANVYQSANWEDDGEYIQWTQPSAGWSYPSGGATFCLYGDPTSVLTDNFPDTYTVQILFGDSAGTYTVTRRTACVWSEFAEGEDFGGVRIVGGSLPDGTMNWSAGAFSGGSSDQGSKLGDLNTPEGNYGDFGTTETLIIVSE